MRNWSVIVLVLLMAFTFSMSAIQSSLAGGQQSGSRNAGVKPKRTSERGDRTRRDARSGASRTKSGVSNDASTSTTNILSPALASADFDLVGLAVTVDPASLTVPKNTPTSIHTSIRVPEGTDPSVIIATLNPNYRVRGELTGPSLTTPLTLDAAIGQPLGIPALSNAGDHQVSNLRVVDVSTPDQAVITSVTPDSCGIVVIERLLVSQVQVNELTYEEILQAGINITDDSYRAFNFTLGIGTSSTAATINIPVAFPTVGVVDPRPVLGTPSVSGPGVDVPTVYPVMLAPEGRDGDPSGPPQLPGEALPKIPGVIVFPGRVGLLHQFFEAIVIVGNGAPNGTPLIIHSLRAKAKLPDNGTTADLSDDPLRIAETQIGGRVSELELHGLGPDGRYGTGDDTTSFGPNQSGQGTFLLEGLKEGLHPISFDLEAMLEGLPSGPVKVRGEVPGAVLVRDASFAVTFTHPGIVRAGNEYDLGMTVYNSGQTDINGAFAQLPPNSISGAEFVGQDSGLRNFATTIKRGESATVKWRLRANVTGEVTASYVKVGEGVSAGLALVTGVGDRNIPLSPDSLILPEPVRHLPPGVVEAGRALLGQAWSIANAPPGSLPRGVTGVTKQTVVDRAVELGIAGMRVDFGEPVSVSLATTLRDWLGELQDVPDPGFADTQRNTRSGYEWFDSIGAEFYHLKVGAAAPMSSLDLHQQFANTELPRSPFISALVTQTTGDPVLGARLVNAQGQQVGFGPTEGERAGDLAQGSSLRLAHRDIVSGAVLECGQMMAVSDPSAGEWTLELNGWRTGTFDVSVVVPATSQTYKIFSWSGIAITQGGKHRIRFKPLDVSSNLYLEELRTNGWEAEYVTTVTTLNQPPPRVVGVIQVTPSVVAGGDKYGRLIGVLFSKPMSETQAETLSRYTIGGGTLKGSNPPQLVGDPIGITGARVDYGNRFVFMGMNSTIGPYIDRDLTVASMVDTRGLSLSQTTRSIQTRVSPEGVPPGAYLTGRVLNADGSPVVNAPVITWAQDCPDPAWPFPPAPKPIVLKYTNAQGRYVIDYVRDGDCAPLNVSVRNPTTNSEKRLTSAVAYDGQHMVLDMVFLARGNVEGNVTSGGQPMPRAFVRVVPDLDVVGTKVVQADANGHYRATDIPVGNVSVLAVGAGAASNASGFNAGTITGPGLTALINVSLQNISGVVSGRVYRADGNVAPGSLVVAYAVIAGFPTSRGDGATAVGYAFADRDGAFSITNLPVGAIKLEVTDYVTGLIAQQNVQLTNTIPEVSGLVITLPGFGSVSGRVTDDTGTALPGVFVSCSGRAVQTDHLGNYTLQSIPAGMKSVSAYDPETQRSGSAQAPITIGQTTLGINIVILRPSTLRGTVYVIKEGTTTPEPAAGVRVSADGFRIVDTNAQGQYFISGVSPGDATIRFVDEEKKYAVNTPVKLLPGEVLIKDATFRPGTIHGKVFQPDGVTPTIAQLTVYVPRPEPTIGFAWGLIATDPPLATQSAADGSYSLSGVNPGTYRISTSNVFFPTRVSGGGTLAPSGNAETNLVLVSTLAGKIQGSVFQPDGTTSAGPGIRVTLSGGSLADVTVRTDESGHYEFAEVFSAGSYHLTATDPVSGNVNRIGVSIERNKDAVFNLRLLGSGNLCVYVVDGAGQPVSGGSVTIDGSEYPNAHRFAEIPVGLNGKVEFNNLPEGSYGVSATRFGLGGRVSAIVTLGNNVDVTVQLQATGNVEGHVYLPDGTTPISLTDVQLRVGGRPIGFTVTSEEPDIGKFSFVNVPTGDFTLDVFDNHTGRVGRAAGSVTTQGETVVVNVLLLPIGAVSGQVTANGVGVDHASVRIYADGSGVRGANLFATTDPTGHYRFTGIPAGRFVISVADAPGGQTGSASGTISGTVEPLPDTIVNIALEPSQTVTGTVFLFGGTERVPGAQVTITVGGRVFHTATNDQGIYSLGFVPLGEVRVRAEAPVGYDRGEAAPVSGTQAGGTITANVTLAGVGSVAGEARDNNGALLTAGTVAFTNNAWNPAVVLYASVQPNGQYEIPGAPAGHFSLRLTVPGRVGVGSAAGDVFAGQATNVTLQLEDAGTVTGRAYSANGTTPVQGASVSVTLFRSGGALTFFAHTNAQGIWTLNNVPLGTIDIHVTDEVSGGVARARNVALTTNGQTVDVGAMSLDNTPISVASVVPANGTQALPTTGTVITITFSEPAEASSVHSGTVQLQLGSSGVGTTLVLSADGRVATLTPVNHLAENATYKVYVNGVEDRAGLRIASVFNSFFMTADETAPVVATFNPANKATEFPLDGSIVVTFNEPIDSSLNLASIITVAPLASPQATLTGSYQLDATGRIATFTPAAPFGESTRYTITVSGQRDLEGNTQTQSVVSNFSADDQTAPVIDPLPIDGTSVNNSRPTITATYNDNLTGIKTSSVVLTVDNVNVTPSATITTSQVTYTPAASLALGSHTVTVQVADNGGNTSAVRNATFTVIDNTPPSVTATSPANNATNVPVNTAVVVSFNEPLDPAVNLAEVVKVTDNQAPATPLPGSYQLDPGGTVATFQPNGGFNHSTQYTITVNGARDPSGNIQTQAVIRTFSTPDLTAPVIDPLPIDGTTVRVYKPTIIATYHDSPSGINTSTLVLTVDNINVTQNATVTGSQVTYTPSTSLSGGHHTVTVQVTDNAGNVSALRSAAFDIDDSGPEITSFTIGGTPAVDGMYVTSSLQPVFAISYTDDTGINLSATQLLFAPQGSPLVQVPATKTQTGLTYQPPSLLAEGPYAVQAIITNNLGTSSTTGVINFTLDADAPEVTSVTPSTGNQHGGTTVTITGARLLNTTGTAPTVTIGGNPTQVTSAVAGSPDVVTIITPAGVPGPATIQMNTNRGTGVLVGGFTYQADPRTPFTCEPDTVLLWHMDENANGAVRVNDSGNTRSIFGTAGASSLVQPGRFAFGRSNAVVVADSSTLLQFNNTSFTVEGWVLTNPVGRTYTLFGREDSLGGQFSHPSYSVRLYPNGTLRALAYDTGNRQWFVDVPTNVYRVEDNQWHYIAMVVDRASNRLSLYIDGVERGWAAPPVGFANLVTSGNLRVGKWAYYEAQTTGGNEPFPGTIDEIRVSSTAHSPEVIQKTYLGTEGALGVTIANMGPLNLGRGTTTEVQLTGYNLAGTTASITGPPAGQVTAQVLSSAATQARVQITVSSDAQLGDAQLVMSSSAGSASLALRLIELSNISLAVEPDTRLLWHLNETGNGAVTVFDETPLRIHGTAGGSSLAQPGRFNGGRSLAVISSGLSNANLHFGGGSFTVEGWVKTDVVGRTYTIFGKEDSLGGQFSNPEFAVRLFPSGTLRALAYDTSNRLWLADLPATTYRVDDNQWHYVAMVVDRTIDRMSLYVDGFERVGSAPPAGFGSLRDTSQAIRAGKWAYYETQTTGGNEPFPGTIDEIRVSATAHSAARILDDMIGSSPMRITSYSPKGLMREKAGLPSTNTTIVVNGYNLDGVSASLRREGQPVDAVVNVVSSSARQAMIDVDVLATAPLGIAQLVLSKPGQTDVSADLRISEQAELVPALDTLLMWNLNETGNGAVRVYDSNALGIHGTADVQSEEQPGRFGKGRAKANIISDPDNKALYLGFSSFTVECWVKTGPVPRAYTLVGKEDQLGGQFYNPEFSLRLSPAGGLRAYAYDQSNRLWKAEMPPLTLTVDDNQWHHVALVVDRAIPRMMIYVDGIERASGSMPAGFSNLRDSGQPFRVGKWAYYEENSAGGPEEFPGIIDDARLSNTAHSAERISADLDGVPGLRVNSYGPREIQRNPASGPAQFTQITASGFGLDGVTATVQRDGQLLDATVVVDSSSFNQAQFSVSAASTVTPGPAQLVLAKPGLPTVPLDVRISERSEFATDVDTRLLWHLNETGNGAVHVSDSGPLSIGGTADAQSIAEPVGHFGGARRHANIVSDADYDALYLGTLSFTVETWMKTGPVPRAYSLVAKEDNLGGQFYNPEFSLRLSPTGGLRAYAYDNSNRQWKAEMTGRTYDPATGRWSLIVDDNQWHHVAMVVDRSSQRMIIYVDGIERASGNMPAGFSNLRTSSQPVRVGKWAYYEENNAGGPEEFPGLIDEVRISSSAHSAARILADAMGTDTARLSSMQPSYAAKGSVAVPVTFTGFGLAGATVTTDQPEVTLTVTSTTSTNINCLMDVPTNASIGQLNFNITTAQSQVFTSALTIVDHQPFSNAANSGTETVVLWHLDETANGALHFNGAGDPVPAVIGGNTSSVSTAADGRFGKGRVKANITADTANNSTHLGSSSFTLECWVKGGSSVTRAYTLVGREDNLGGQFYNPEYSIRLTPSGGLRGYTYDTSNRQWKVEMPGHVFDAATGRYLTTMNDGQWHYVALVADRAAGRLTLYADGVERASSTMPAGFASTRDTPNPLRVGKWAYYEDNNAGGPEEFPGTIDEVRIQNVARTAAQISDTWFGTNTAGSAPNVLTPAANVPVPTQPKIAVNAVTPGLVTRNKAAQESSVTNITIDGANLSGVTAQIMRDGQLLSGVVASVKDSADARAHLAVAVAPATPLGLAQLILSKTGFAEVAVEIRVVEQSEFALEPDTVGLWHLDEREAGVAHLLDASENAINLTSSQSSRVAEGRFGGGRTLTRATADAGSQALALGASSFTVESWVKTSALERDYVLVGKETNTGQNTDFTLKALSSGGLRAEVYDASGVVWQVETLPGTVSLTDGWWHSVAMVVDRENGMLALYVDGQISVAAPAPVGFGAMRNLGQPLEFGCFDADSSSGSGPEEFPGVLDELRISSTAHGAEKIAADFFGHDAPLVTLVRPAIVRKANGPAEVTLSGYGLAGASVRSNQPGIAVTVISATATSIRLSLALSDSATAGPVILTITDTLGRSSDVELKVVEGMTGSRFGNSSFKVSSSRGSFDRQVPASSDRRSPETPANRSLNPIGASLRTSRSTPDASRVGGQR